MGGRSYSPSPPRGGRYGRRGRSPSPRGRYGGSSRGRDLPTSLLVRNLRLDCRPEDLRRPFGEFGPLKDIYLPRDYYSGEPRGFGFVQFVDPADAAEAKYQMDGQVFQGRELTVVFAEENRKKPADMRSRERRFVCGGGSRYSDRRRSPPHRHSPPPRYARSRSRSREYSPPPKRRHHSRSVSPRGKRYSRERSYSESPLRSRSPSQSPIRDRSPPPYNGSRSPSQSPERVTSAGRSPSRSRSPDPRDYARGKPKRGDSVSP
ncbi:serine/arginine-rich SC35-like splicing factor SCL30A isoform X1 [Bidens hawaiensis]|uniref:serine/arginine-rich SC35-like splicing factor SCL30A isoform X1 n=1 Tax=Bidens hawaiensis TaxID=980011 RepID=UPI00404B4959